MNEDNHSYTSCYLQDLLKEIAILKNKCTITYLNQKNEFVKVGGLIVDIYAVDSYRLVQIERWYDHPS